EINSKLYSFLKSGFNEASNCWKKTDLGIIFTVINVNEFWWREQIFTYREVKVYTLPLLSMKNIQLLSKIIIKDHIDPISCDGQLNLLLILSQGRPRIVTELLLAKAEKRTNLF